MPMCDVIFIRLWMVNLLGCGIYGTWHGGKDFAYVGTVPQYVWVFNGWVRYLAT